MRNVDRHMASTPIVLCLLLFLSAAVTSQNINSGQCSITREPFVENASIRFGLLMTLSRNDINKFSDSPYTCALISREPLQSILAAEWAVERLNNANNGTGYIPGVKIGFYSMDDCRSPVYSSRNALSFLDYWVPAPTVEKICNQSEKETLHIGLIGPSRSASATRVASLLRDLPVPIISMSATSSELSNTVDYPTFFRTVPSDTHQMNMIIQILEQLSWTYVAVVHSNDDYGISASKILSDLAVKKGICIFKMISLGSDSTSYGNELPGLIKSPQAAKDYSIAIPFIGPREKAEKFMEALNSMRKIDDKDVRFGIHLILSESTNTDPTIYDGKLVGVGTLTIASSNIFLDDLYADLTDKVQQVADKKKKHNFIERFIRENKPSFPLISPNVLDSFVPLTIHAVFALAEAIRMEHLDACKGVPGVCSALKANVEKGNILKQVKNVTVNYKLMGDIPPRMFRENNYSVSFDSNGDIKLNNKSPLYSIYQYRTDKTYEMVGSYIDGQTILKMDKLSFTTPAGSMSPNLPTSVCSGQCSDCLNDKIIPTAFLEGDVYIVGVFSIHKTNDNNPFKCGEFRSVGNDVVSVEAFLFAVKDLRKITGINFGAIAIDDCYSPVRSTTILSRYFSSLLLVSNSSDFTHSIPKEKIAGVVGSLSSGCTVSTAHFFMPLKIPVVSYSASTPDLDSKIDFPYFMRTVPSDVYMAQAILKILKAMDWEYIGLLYVENNYGAKATEAFKDAILKDDLNICIGAEEGISESDSDADNADFRNIYSKFVTQNIKVVVFIGIDVRFKKFLSTLESLEYYGKFIFIGGEDWGVNRDIYNAGRKTARGSITLKIQDIQLENYSQFKDHLASKKPITNDTNIWFAEFWQNEFKCNLRGGFFNEYGKDCDSTEVLTAQQLDSKAGEQRVTQVFNSVYALGKGLAEAKKNLCEDSFPCKQFYQNAESVVAFIKNQTRQQGNLKLKVFDSNGNGALGFDIYNIQQTSDGNPYVMVGNSRPGNELGGNDFNKDKLKFYGEAGNILSEYPAKCTKMLCQQCPGPKTSSPEENKQSSSIPEFRQSDILLISLIIVLILAIFVAIFAVIVFFTRKYKGLKKQLESYKEEIYDEPDKIVYQPYTDTHGIRFSNANNPYPIVSSLGLTTGENSASDINGGGVTNLAFVPEFDSVSQEAMSVRNRHRSSPSESQSQTRRGPISLVSSGQYVSPYSSRPLPVSPTRSDSTRRKRNANHTGANIRSERRMTTQTSLSSDQSNMARASDLQSLTGGQVCLMPLSSLRGNDTNGSDVQGGIVYYMQGENGQLAPHITSSPIERGALLHQHQPLQKQASIRSQISSANSAVNPSYGPYSTAAAQRVHLPQRPQFLNNNNNRGNPLMYSNTPIVNSNAINYNDSTTIPNQRSIIPITNQAYTDQEVDYSPIHFTNTPQEAVVLLSTPHYQAPSSQMIQLQQVQTNPMNDSLVAALTNDNNQINHNNLQFPYQDQELFQEQESSDNSPDRSPDHSGHSMISSSIPDVVGQSSPAIDPDREISMESINLSSSRESLDNINTEVKDSNAKKNKNGLLRAFSALSGNVSRV